MARRRILVTGGSGYVGRTVVRQLYGEHDVLVLDSFEFGEDRLTDFDRARIKIAPVSIRDAAAVQEVVASFQPDVILHLAAVHFIPLCEANPELAMATNVLGTVNLLRACPPGTRFVFASSAAVYQPDSRLHDEATSGLHPNDVYGFTKLHAEQFVRYFSGIGGFPAVIVRLFNVVGPGETNPHLLPELITQLKSGQSVIRLGNTWPKRDYIHVDDAARGFATVATRTEIAPGTVVTVNLGTSVQLSVEEVVARIRDLTDAQFTIETDPSRVRPVDRPFLGADIGRIRDLFDWKPRYGIDDAIVDLWRAPIERRPVPRAAPLPSERAGASHSGSH